MTIGSDARRFSRRLFLYWQLILWLELLNLFMQQLLMHFLLRHKCKAVAAFCEAEQQPLSHGVEERVRTLAHINRGADVCSIGHRPTHTETEGQDLTLAAIQRHIQRSICLEVGEICESTNAISINDAPGLSGQTSRQSVRDFHTELADCAVCRDGTRLDLIEADRIGCERQTASVIILTFPDIEVLRFIELVLIGLNQHNIIPDSQSCAVGVSTEAEAAICSC